MNTTGSRSTRRRLTPADFAARFWGRVDRRPDGCWIWTGGLFPVHGYGRLFRDGQALKAHRVALELTTGQIIPSSKWVLHHCDTRACVRPDHLYIGSRADNTRDMVIRQRQAREERQGSAKLTVSQVAAIRRRAMSGEFYPSIARDYGINKKTVRDIAIGEGWRTVGGPLQPRYRGTAGERNGRAKLDGATVLKIREERASGARVATLAARHGITPAGIRHILKGAAWGTVGGPLSLVDDVRQPLKGEANPRSKFTVDMVRAIRAETAAGMSRGEIARRYGTTPTNVRFIVTRRTWAHVG